MTAPRPTPFGARDLVAEAITEAMGPRCVEHDPDCLCCQTWAQYDQTVRLTLPEYQRLLAASESDDMIVRCETCGAWLDRDEAACASVEDFTGCWKVATRLPEHEHLCVSHRAPEVATPIGVVSSLFVGGGE